MGLFDGTSLERPVTCARCEQTLELCQCPRSADGTVTPPSRQQVRVRREKRRGKWTTVAEGFDAEATDVVALLKAFKTQLGVGGTVKGPTIELQGDHRDRLVEALKGQGYPAKPSGG